ncbi:excalibur calcium-binding domain-containing protein [Bacillus thuringiensis]|uniref:Cell wall anchor protein n=3 Tax=Bacillus cereus group TaxID=86661 RepID=A0ABD5HVG8_BACTU|nr:excalibur calcium-binding domain-containing protein [Bacillus thuringiensis]EEM97778.1 Lpxtg-motif cell wall anchor domain protein [Bacillus thuringiensis IBL 200]MCR6778897.1 excalibur calcium-binding domain-containing protein [Bacillus thuringiensis]MCR6856965.1 excalibur calcium-binding domain-containing protein [Bacillus thuringiensis]MCR6867819.1 excalibur calcium-binding domain-containing protein [Bacillus thuringiensis]MDW9208907.1 cell wall anchor protein [Bacillus thuringiensis ser
MKKLLASATAVTLLTVGYSSSAFAAKSPNDTKNCGHFKSQQDAQAFWDQNGYGVGNDPHRLDNDKDGIPCEDYKYPKSTNTTTENKETTKPQEQPKQENTKQENTKQENTKQENTKQENTKQENTKQENTKQEPVKQENTKQENSKQNNQTTNNKQEQTKPQTTAKETKKNTNTVVKKETKKQGEKLPNTASNGVTMMLASLGLALAGSVLMFRRKKTNA